MEAHTHPFSSYFFYLPLPLLLFLFLSFLPTCFPSLCLASSLT